MNISRPIVNIKYNTYFTALLSTVFFFMKFTNVFKKQKIKETLFTFNEKGEEQESCVAVLNQFHTNSSIVHYGYSVPARVHCLSFLLTRVITNHAPLFGKYDVRVVVFLTIRILHFIPGAP